MEILLILAIYIIPVIRFLWLGVSKKVKEKIVKREHFVYACLLYGLLSLINSIVVFVLISLKPGGASGVPLVLLIPIQILLIIIAERLVAKSKSTSLKSSKGYRESSGEEWLN
jgi:hypothetical protein